MHSKILAIDENVKYLTEYTRDITAPGEGEYYHSSLVTQLAMSILQQINNLEIASFTKRDAEILFAASVLHDIGYAHKKSNPDNHNIYSMEMILQKELALSPVFSKEEIKIVALIAKYHRDGEPHKKDKYYEDLNKIERNKVSKLSAILRIADVLDREHEQAVKNVALYKKNKDLFFILLNKHNKPEPPKKMFKKENKLKEKFKLKGHLFNKKYMLKIKIANKDIIKEYNNAFN